ncbi:hypothetical protein Tco_0319799 [Tanacetum coccineum]
MNVLQEMTMASNAYKTHKNNEKQIIEILISGFAGCLKGWWDHYLTEAEKDIIFKAKKTIVKIENGVQVQTQEDDMVNTLIFVILKNFVGDPSIFKEKSSAILLNLTCRKLSDFKWYRDIFITKVTTRPDCREAYWKERFIAGLPKIFAERIRNKLSDHYKGQIPYRELTYGDMMYLSGGEVPSASFFLCVKDKIHGNLNMAENWRVYSNEGDEGDGNLGDVGDGNLGNIKGVGFIVPKIISCPNNLISVLNILILVGETARPFLNIIS